MTDLLNPTTMTKTYGRQPETMPKGFFKAIQFPVLAMLDTKTGDRRMLLSTGADVRGLPLSVKFQLATAEYGHTGAVTSGALFEVTIDPENNLMSGLGFLLDDKNGHDHARMVYTGAQRGNSVDLAEVRARFVEDMDSGEYWIEFTQFKLAATTGVATPAFAEAHATIDDGLTDDELMASMLEDPMSPLVVEVDEYRSVIVGAPVDNELTAAMSQLSNFDAFYRPEADIPHKVIIDADLNVYGHLALWESCWGDQADRCLRPPRPQDNYASFNQPGVLSERGVIGTGPIFAFGGHRKAKSAPTIEQAYGGIENAWCDVRVIEGKHGPWLSGKVRPGIPDEVVYAARASRISGHWVNGNLRAIVSVNVEAFNIPGVEGELAAGFAFHTEGEEITELVASFPSCVDETPQRQLTLHFANDAELLAFAQSFSVTTETTETTTVELVSIDLTPDDDPLRVWADQRLADILGDERDDE